MPRLKTIITNEFPYHVIARANNKEPFRLQGTHLWNIFTKALNNASKKLGLRVHAFVLMNNHYHLIASFINEPISMVMHSVQLKVTQNINYYTESVNHVFGGPYRPSLITDPYYYANLLKYVYRNPVKAGLTLSVNDYKLSTLNNDKIVTVSPLTGIETAVPKINNDFINWLDQPFENEANKALTSGIQRTVFKVNLRKLEPKRLYTDLC